MSLVADFAADFQERRLMRQHLKKGVSSGVLTGIHDVSFGKVERNDDNDVQASFAGVASNGLPVKGSIMHQSDGTFVATWDYAPAKQRAPA